MFDFISNLRKSSEEQELETINAFLDDAMSPQERARFSDRLSSDDRLLREVETLRAIKAGLRHLPRASAPRSFVLDPAKYGKPARQPIFTLYPAVRTASVIMAIFFVAVLVFDVFTAGGRIAEPQPGEVLSNAITVEMEAQEEALERAVEPAPEVTLQTEDVEVTRRVEETVAEAPLAAEAIAEEEVAGEEASALEIQEEDRTAGAAGVDEDVEGETPSLQMAEPLLTPALTQLPSGGGGLPTQTLSPTGSPVAALVEPSATSFPVGTAVESFSIPSPSPSPSPSSSPSPSATSGTDGAESVALSARVTPEIQLTPGFTETVSTKNGAEQSPLRLVEYILGIAVIALILLTLLLRQRIRL